MENQQGSMVEMTTSAPAPQKKSKLGLVIAIIVILIVAVLASVAVVLLSRPKEESPTDDAVNKDSDVLQIYAELKDQIAIDDIYNEVRNINAGATVELDDGVGYIKMSDDSVEDYITFYYESEPEEVDEANEDDIPANVAYGFTYVLPFEGDMGKSIYCSDTCEYFDGTEEHEYMNKKDAINAFLGK